MSVRLKLYHVTWRVSRTSEDITLVTAFRTVEATDEQAAALEAHRIMMYDYVFDMFDDLMWTMEPPQRVPRKRRSPPWVRKGR